MRNVISGTDVYYQKAITSKNHQDFEAINPKLRNPVLIIMIFAYLHGVYSVYPYFIKTCLTSEANEAKHGNWTWITEIYSLHHLKMNINCADEVSCTKTTTGRMFEEEKNL